jgi:hypothetical protein
MTSLAGSCSALVASISTYLVRRTAECTRKLCNGVLAAMQNSSERKAARAIARYGQLASDQSADMTLPEQSSQS